MKFMTFISQWLLPVLSIVISVSFALSAKKDSEKASLALTNINNAVEDWQRQLMNSMKNILDSTPQVIEAKLKLAEIEKDQKIIECIHSIGLNPQPGAAGATQNENIKILISKIKPTN